MSTLYERELETALLAAREAAVLCRSASIEIAGKSLAKDDRSPVTVADFASQALICHHIRKAFPDDPIVGEERSEKLATDGSMLEEVVRHVERRVGDKLKADQVRAWIDAGSSESASNRFWTVDPVDGTKGFLRGDQYAVAIALIVDGLPVVAALACPQLKHETMPGVALVATRDGGAFATSLDGVSSSPRMISVSKTDSVDQAIICESFESEHSAHDVSADVALRLGTGRDRIRMDSQAKYGLVALGRSDIYLRIPTSERYAEKIWDHAAGALIVEEAGGRVTDVNGEELDFSRGPRLDANAGVIATNGAFHDAVVDAVRSVRQSSN